MELSQAPLSQGLLVAVAVVVTFAFMIAFSVALSLFPVETERWLFKGRPPASKPRLGRPLGIAMLCMMLLFAGLLVSALG